MSIILTEKRQRNESGYFRIGYVVLDIPPESILTNKVLNNQEVQPLRYPTALGIKTGHARWDVTVSWKVLVDTSGSRPDYRQWDDLRTVLAMFKAAPFVEVENAHLRQVFTNVDPVYKDARLAFGLRQLKVDSLPDNPDGLQVTLTMSLFNYHPYSRHFAYRGQRPEDAFNADQSPEFRRYIEQWKELNLDGNLSTVTASADGKIRQEIDGLEGWKQQTPGTLQLFWRQYIAERFQAPAIRHKAPLNTALTDPRVPIRDLPDITPPDIPGPDFGPIPDIAVPPPVLAPPPPTQQTTPNLPQGCMDLEDNVFIDGTDRERISWLTAALRAGETHGRGMRDADYLASNPLSSATGILQWLQGSAIEAMRESDILLGTGYIAAARQSGHLSGPNGRERWNSSLVLASTGKRSGSATTTYRNWMRNPPDGVRSTQDNMAIGWVRLQLRRSNGSALGVLRRHRGLRLGNQLHECGLEVVGPGTGTPDSRWWRAAVETWRSMSGNPAAFAKNQPATAPRTTASSSNPTIPSQPTPPGTPRSPSQGTSVPGSLSPSTGAPPHHQFPAAASAPAGQATVRSNTSEIVAQMAAARAEDGWELDHYTDTNAFFFKAHQLKLADEEHGDEGDVRAYPSHISVVFTNNLSQLPLAAYQYPTFQHVGPASTFIAVGIQSVSEETKENAEPQHPGITSLSQMITSLENQFHQLRHSWRAVSSVHRMQALFVKNQVLNMLGIRGLLVRDFTTTTVPESPDILEATLSATQYENIFEVLEPYRVKGITSLLRENWSKVLREPAGSKLDQMQGYPRLKQLRKDISSRNEQALLDFLLKSNEYPYVALPVELTSQERGLVVAALHMTPANEQHQVPAFGAAGLPAALMRVGSLADRYPDIAKRIDSHVALTYTDFFIVTRATAGIAVASDLSRLKERIEGQLSSNHPIDQLFDLMLGQRIANDPLLTAEMEQFESQAPDLFGQANSGRTPGSDPENIGHGAYRDLGLVLTEIGGLDNNPALYFYNDQNAVRAIADEEMSKAVGKAVRAAEVFNRQDAQTGIRRSSSEGFISPSVSVSSRIRELVRKVNLPFYSMSRAFPTFKLFLMEEDNSGIFNSLDDFYSYSSVLDIEIIRYRDKPDVAILQLTNLAYLLSIRLFDNSSQGRRELRDHGGAAILAPTSPEGPVAGPAPRAGVVQETLTGINLQETYPGGNKFPLRYFALQTGTKIQIRMGFSNNPDKLVPVFTGMITQIEGEEVLTVTAQGYQLELMDPAGDELRSDGYFNLSTLYKQPVALLVRSLEGIRAALGGSLIDSGNIFSKLLSAPPAYGGGSLLGGDAGSVLEDLLKVSSAKHFGHWQVGGSPDPYLKGFRWSEVAGKGLQRMGFRTVGAALESAYDRRGENILVNHMMNLDGSVESGPDGIVTRPWWYERPLAFLPAAYHVPKDPDLTPWMIMQDVARRYPEYVLGVKQYGFPYAADVTLVYADPNDWYVSRPRLAGEGDLLQLSYTDNHTFFEWWKQEGRSLFENFVRGPGRQFTFLAVKARMGEDPILKPEGLEQFWRPDIFETEVGFLLNSVDAGGGPVFHDILGLYEGFAKELQVQILRVFGNLLNVDPNVTLRQIVILRQHLIAFLQRRQRSTSSDEGTASPRLRPVRQWHFVNQDTILHNGITLNDQIFNGVRLAGDTISANAMIPPHYQRLLNVDRQIIDVTQNVVAQGFQNAYAQSFLKEELGRMYQGELVLAGVPDIEPHDIVMILDPSRDMVGPVEVDSVIHSFNQETGYITIVKPRAVVALNDRMTAGIWVAMKDLWSEALARLEGVSSVNLGLAGAGTIAGATAAALAAPWVTAAALLGTLGLTQLLASKSVRMNPMFIAPLTRFGRPWIGGLQGWSHTDLLGLANDRWDRFVEDEIDPLIDSYRQLRGLLN